MSRSTKPVTIKDIAAKAGVSVATVSRVLNDKPSVRPTVRRTVKQVIQEVGYELRSPAKGATQKPTRIGLIIPDITNPYFSLLIKGITNIAVVYKAEIILCNSDKDPEKERFHLKTQLETDSAGLIFIPFSEHIDPLVIELVESRFPMVFLDRELKRGDICTVASDNEEGAYQATNYLLKLGHRDIVFISGPSFWSTSVTRFEGFNRALREFGIEINKEMILYGDASEQSAYLETKKLLAAKIKFSAVFASNDLMAFGAWKGIEESGLRVPGDISIIGYDDIPFSAHLALTTIAQPSYEVGRNALMLLMDVINKRREPLNAFYFGTAS